MSGPQKQDSAQNSQAGSGTPANTGPAAPNNPTTPTDTAAPAALQGKTGGGGGGGGKSKWAKLAQGGGANGSVKRAGSLGVPRGDGDNASERSGGSSGSGRRGSKLSLGSQLSGLDLNKLQLQQAAGGGVAAEEEGTEDKGKNSTVNNDSYLRSAIPYLPQWVAVICLIMNIIIPGSGTILSGFSVFCCGKPRVATKGDQVMETFCVNIWVGIIQLCTVTFMLVGWFWSFVWGIYMIILAVELERTNKEKHEKQLQAMALHAFNADVRPWSLGN